LLREMRIKLTNDGAKLPSQGNRVTPRADHENGTSNRLIASIVAAEEVAEVPAEDCADGIFLGCAAEWI